MSNRPIVTDHAHMDSTVARRLILVPAAASPRERPPTPGVRRFRLAQLRLEGREVPRAERFTHLKRVYD